MKWIHGVPGFATPFRFVRDTQNSVVAYVEGSRETAEKNGRIIAAAPELLEALRLLQKAVHDEHLLDVKKRFSLCVADAAAAKAIAKAEGRL